MKRRTFLKGIGATAGLFFMAWPGRGFVGWVRPRPGLRLDPAEAAAAPGTGIPMSVPTEVGADPTHELFFPMVMEK